MKKSVQNRKSVAGQRRKEKREGKERRVKFAPLAQSMAMGFGVPQGQRSHRFPYRELVAGVNGSVAFATTRYVINPGLSASFPRLSGMADKWEQYRFHSLRYVYVPRSAASAAGSVILTPDYCVRDLPPTTAAEAADNMNSVENVIWTDIVCKLDVGSMFAVGPRKYLRQSNVPGDMNLYDCGNFYVTTSGTADTSEIGRLYVEYDVELFVAQNSPADYLGPTMIQQFLRATAQTFTTATPAVIDWDTPSYNPLFIVDAAGTVTPRAGCYLVSFTGSFNDATNETFSSTASIRKNGVVVLTAQAESSTSGPNCLASNVVISCSGSDTVDVLVTLVGAAGVLTLLATSGSLTFVPA